MCSPYADGGISGACIARAQEPASKQIPYPRPALTLELCVQLVVPLMEHSHEGWLRSMKLHAIAFKALERLRGSSVFKIILNADHEEGLYGQSPNLFLETLTHRSSWVMPPMRHRRREFPSLGRQSASLPADYDLHNLEEEEAGSHSGSPEGLLHAALQQSNRQEPAVYPGYATMMNNSVL